MQTSFSDMRQKCRRYARQIWREQPDLPVDELLQRYEITHLALGTQEVARDQIIEWVLPDSTPHEELPFFRNLELWSIEEAVAIWNDVNPFIFLQSFKSFKPSFWNQAFHPNLREAYHLLLDKARRSSISGELITTREGDIHWVSPKNFYEWAKTNGLVPNGTRPEDFFDDLARGWEVAETAQGIHNPPSPTKPTEQKLDRIREILSLIKQIDPDFSHLCMPGLRSDFHELCKSFDYKLFMVSSATFNEYIKGVCKFKSGARKSDYYENLRTKLGDMPLSRKSP